MPAEGLNLNAGKAYAALVNAPSSQCGGGTLLVKPGAVGESYLVNKLTGQGMCFGSRMPKGGSSLSQAQIDLVRTWICAGAPNN